MRAVRTVAFLLGIAAILSTRSAAAKTVNFSGIALSGPVGRYTEIQGAFTWDPSVSDSVPGLPIGQYTMPSMPPYGADVFVGAALFSTVTDPPDTGLVVVDSSVVIGPVPCAEPVPFPPACPIYPVDIEACRFTCGPSCEEKCMGDFDPECFERCRSDCYSDCDACEPLSEGCRSSVLLVAQRLIISQQAGILAGTSISLELRLSRVLSSYSLAMLRLTPSDCGQILITSMGPGGIPNFQISGNVCMDSAIQVVDPNPGDQPNASRPLEQGLIDEQGRIIGASSPSDIDRLASRGFGVSRIATDGVTPVLIRIPSESAVTFSIQGADLGDDQNRYGSLLPVADVPLQIQRGSGTEELKNVAPRSGPNGEKVAMAIYLAPSGYADISNPIVIVASTSSGEPLDSVDLTLVPPPVSLVHGIWGGPGDFTELQGDLEARGLIVDAVDYGQDGASFSSLDIRSNRPVGTLDAVIRSRLRASRNAGFAVTRVNVVAHSMGGLVTRTREIVLGSDYFRPSTFGGGDIHKLITIDTPHAGSPIAIFTLTTCLDLAMNGAPGRFGAPTRNGGLEDLVSLPLSPALLQLPKHPSFLVHAIVGSANEEQEIRSLYRQQTLTFPWCGSCPCSSDADCGEGGTCLLRHCKTDWVLNQYTPCESRLDCPLLTDCVPAGRCVTGEGTFCERGATCETPGGGTCGGARPYSTPDYLTTQVYGEQHDISVPVSSSRANPLNDAITPYDNVVHSKSWGGIWGALTQDGDSEVVLNAPLVRTRVIELLLDGEASFGHL